MTLRVNILVRTRHSRCLEDYRVSRSRASRAASWRLCPPGPWPPGLQAALPQALEEGRRDAKRCHHQGLRVHPEDDDASDADEHGEREGRGLVYTSGPLRSLDVHALGHDQVVEERHDREDCADEHEPVETDRRRGPEDVE